MGNTSSSAIVGYVEETGEIRRTTRQRDDQLSHALNACPPLFLNLYSLSLTMSSVEQLLEKAQSCSNPKESERIYKQILSTVSGEGRTRKTQPNLQGFESDEKTYVLDCTCSIDIKRRATTGRCTSTKSAQSGSGPGEAG